MLTKGQIFEGRYEVGEVLGEGGFAVVYAARRADGMPVALKVLKPDHDNGYAPDTRGRFQREVALIAQLNDPHTVQLLEWGDSGGLLWMAFEHVSGRDLAEALSQFGSLPAVHVEHILRQLLASLGEAHRLGIVHRDLKPQNIRVYVNGDDPLAVKLLDFGIARAFDEGHPSMTKTGELIGTPRYMSPEQLRGAPLTPASDIYSLGVVAFELLCGTKALGGASLLNQIERLHTGHAFTIGDVDSAGPLGAIIARMTATDVDQRLHTAAAVLAALDGPTPRGPARTVRVVEHTATPPGSKWLPALVGTAVGLALGAAWFATTNDVEPDVERYMRPNPLAVPRVEESRREAKPEPEEPEAIVDDFDEMSSCGVPLHPTSALMGALSHAIPRDYDPETRYPLVIALHSEYQKAQTFMDETGFAARAREGGFIVIAPSDFDDFIGKNSWHNGDYLERIRANAALAQDTYCIDPARIYVAGNNYGGRPALQLSCEAWIAGSAVHGFALKRELADGCKSPRPLLWMHSLHSPSVPVETDTNCNGHKGHSLADVRKMLKARSDCRGRPTETERSGDTHCETWSCDVPFEFCYVDGGNVWTGMHEDIYNPQCRGDVAPDYDLTEKSLRYFGIVE